MSKKISRGSTPHRLSRPSNIPSPGVHYPVSTRTPIDDFLPQITELSDTLADIDSNVQQIQSIHESLNGFNESFASFLYGLQINAYTVEFNDVPNFEQMRERKDIKDKIAKLEELLQEKHQFEDSYMTNDEDGSFIVQPKVKPNTNTNTNTSTAAKSKIPRRGTMSTAVKAKKKDTRPPFR